MSKTQKTYIDPDGNPVPAKHVSAYDKARDRIANRIARIWLEERTRLCEVRDWTMELIDEVRAMAAKDGRVKLGGAKGYMQFRDFRGRIVVRFENVAQTEFDERLALVQQLIYEAIDDLAGDTTKNAKIQELRKIADAAFKPRGKNGKLDRQRVRDIANVQVNHPKWRKAADLVRECDKVVGHREYVRVLTSPDPAIEKHQPIVLDVSKV